jgi:hypothetical protein
MDQIDAEIWRVAVCFLFSSFPEMSSIAIAGALCSHQKRRKSSIQCNSQATFGHFIAKRRWLEEAQGGPEGDKGLVSRVGRPPSGKAATKGTTKWGVEGDADRGLLLL